MTNRDSAAALEYHESTKHSPASVRRAAHTLDWDNMPRPFKVYTTLEPLPLPRDLHASQRPALAAIAGAAPVRGGPPAAATVEPALELELLTALLHFTAGIVKRRATPLGDSYFRAAACTGNLHHVDVYLICGELPDLPAGVYHFSPHDFALRRLRGGDHRAHLATAGAPDAAAASAVLAFASTLWRNTWKYRERAYRHCFWDSGTMLANLLAVAAARGLPARVVLGFVDADVSRLLGLDEARELALELVALGSGHAAAAPIAAPTPRVDALALDTLPLSAHEVDYPAIRAVHAASSLASSAEVERWRTAASQPPDRVGASRGEARDALIALPAPRDPPAERIEDVILRRGSTREFAHSAIEVADLATVLHAVAQPIPCDFVPAGALRCEVYAIVHAVTGLEPGTYSYDRAQHGLELLRAGTFRREAAFLGLGQQLPGDASALLFWMVDLEPVLAALGNRGYRAAQLEAAIAGGRAYLTAYALRLGASGLTFFDDEVTEFFSPHAAGKSAMFLIALGVPQRRQAAPRPA